ncbi:hypothetical protein CFC21_095108 [Triticum aestivum]|uniref:Uncharacterized protein n=3 Tax=Triticum TaxID=4564 RepID=A0A9R1BH76_TRITD|nr:uncharacterized protein LOC123154817 [Triticum aestivum]XP_044445649.1 uncharacterized protein LOC123172804 [Triticum aestivum]KAF7092647.1 hypothetical protein CFC21_095108 [Triticum aestivum]VAI68512.1 unnamed protein product [Triticum turgidum subsp. durum]
MSMALRNLATRMRSPAAAVLRPRVSPSAGTRPLRSRLFSSLEEDQEDVKRLYQENLATLDRVKKHQEFMRSRIGFLEKSNKYLSWSFKLLLPIPTAAVILKAIDG